MCKAFLWVNHRTSRAWFQLEFSSVNKFLNRFFLDRMTARWLATTLTYAHISSLFVFSHLLAGSLAAWSMFLTQLPKSMLIYVSMLFIFTDLFEIIQKHCQFVFRVKFLFHFFNCFMSYPKDKLLKYSVNLVLNVCFFHLNIRMVFIQLTISFHNTRVKT